MKKNNKKTAIYIRVSTDEQVEGYSISSQMIFCKTFCSNNNFNVYENYIDDGFTGKNLKRPGIKKLLQDISDNIIDNIVAYDMDRISRNVKDIELLVEQCLDHRVDIHTVISGDMRINTADERLIVRFKGAISQHTSEKISEHTIRGLIGGLENGDYIFSTAPFGYFKSPINKKKLIPIEDTLRIIKKIFIWYALDHLSLDSISNKLEREYNIIIKTNALSRILKEEKYTGSFCYRGKEYSGFGLVNLITKEMFDIVQKRLASNYKCAKNIYFFRHKLICKECQGCLAAKSTVKKRKTYLYYTCTNTECICNNKLINQDFIIEKLKKRIVNKYNQNNFSFFNKEKGDNSFKIKKINELNERQIKETIINHFNNIKIDLKNKKIV